tara:strand:+ start:459 stop:1727 length:1269 start_codon:yes stop_codon:yes gene_type:complete
MDLQPEINLKKLFYVGVEAVSPVKRIPGHLPKKPKGRTIVIGAGKASAWMAKVLEELWDEPLSGVVVVPYEHKKDTRNIKIIEAGHPIPDQQSENAAHKMLEVVSNLNADDLVISLMSGGGSSLLAYPIEGIALQDIKLVNRALFSSGACIKEINTVRQAMSGIKGGQLRLAALPAQIVTLVMSDVAGDDPSIIASGPTILPTDSEPVSDILKRYDLNIPDKLKKILTNRRLNIENRKSFEGDTVHIIARAGDALEAAATQAKNWGWEVLNLGDSISGIATEIAKINAEEALQIATFRSASSPPLILLSGGEATVSLNSATGYGGPNSEYLLALALALNHDPKIWALACDTDGIDGNSQNAGGFLTPHSITGATELGVDPTGLLAAHRSAEFFDVLGHNVVTGPTLTNVNDFRSIAICAGAY